MRKLGSIGVFAPGMMRHAKMLLCGDIWRPSSICMKMGAHGMKKHVLRRLDMGICKY
jgi:hypothetical protein